VRDRQVGAPVVAKPGARATLPASCLPGHSDVVGALSSTCGDAPPDSRRDISPLDQISSIGICLARTALLQALCGVA
jgi:hypothetical protein